MKHFPITALAIVILTSCNIKPGMKPPPDGETLAGEWTYRSLLNNPDVNADFDSLEFAAATIKLKNFGTDSVKGQILWPIDSPATQFNGLNLSGIRFYNDTTVCYFMEGIGDSALGTAGWQYNYQGYLVPRWSDGIGQATVLVGSVVRVKKHSCDSSGNNCSPAGLVATTYMVKH